MSLASLSQLLSTPAQTIDDVRVRMAGIAAALPAGDGLAHFNRLYDKVTEAVGHQVNDGVSTFEDPAFLSHLDVVFAERYFAALRAYVQHGQVPRAWRALFDLRDRPGVSALRFAIAGMNAHINFDLSLALVDTAHDRAVSLEPDTRQYRDFERVNALLESTMPAAKRWFSTGVIAVADTALGHADDEVAMWSISKARQAAWVHAETLQALHGTTRLRERYVETLDRTVGLAGRVLLTPQTPLAT